MKIEPRKNAELLAMLLQASRTDLLDGFEVDDAAFSAARAEQDSLHAGASVPWKDAHAAYSAFFASRTAAPQIELDAPATDEERETKVYRALNAFLHDSGETRKAITGEVRAGSTDIGRKIEELRIDTLIVRDMSAELIKKQSDLIVASVTSNTEATLVAAETLAAATRLAADQVSENERKTAASVREVRDRQGEANSHLGAIGKAVADLTIQFAQRSTAQRSLLLDAKNVAEAAALAADHRTAEIRDSVRAGLAELAAIGRRSEMAGYARLIFLIGILLVLALQGRAQTPVAGLGTAGTPKGGVVTVQGASGGTAIPVAPAISTAADGASTCYITSAASTNSTNCKASAGNVYGIYIINTSSTNYFLRMYNASSAPTCSSATGFVETIVALGASANGSGISRPQVPQAYSTGIGFCLTGGGSSTDNTNAATGVYIVILYK